MEEAKNGLAVANTAENLSKEKLLDFLNIAGIASKLNDKERLQFVEIALAYKLNPFKREIYISSYGQGENRTTSIIVGYEVYIKRAERTGKLDGWEVEVSGKLPDIAATVTIYRKDWSRPFKHIAYFEECAQYTKAGGLNAFWRKQPRFMLRKVAIAQGFRLCFSDELGGMPYTADELPSEEKSATTVEAEIVAEKPATIIAAPQAVEAEVVKAEPIKTLGEEEKALIANATSEEELRNIANDLLGQKFRKKEIAVFFNDRLAKLQGVSK